MPRTASTFLALSLAAALSLPSLAKAADAQANGGGAEPAQPVATLQVGGGAVMLSRGGAAFASGLSGAPLFSGERLMVSEQSTATVTYHDGCSQTYDKPGVYEIAASCKLAAVIPAAGGGMTGGQAVALTAGAVLAGGLVGAVAGKTSRSVPPVSH